MYLWQSPDWPHFTSNAALLAPALAQARLAQGRAMGMAVHLGLIQKTELELIGWAEEALATAEIEGEPLQVNSVRASAARRLGLEGAKLLDRDARTEATLDVLEAAVLAPNEPLSHEVLHSWHAALFPTGRSGLQRITTGAYRCHVEPMQIVTPQLGRNDIVHYEAPPSSSIAQQMQGLIDWFNTTSPSAANAANQSSDGLVRAALVHVWFEAIHPYEDGNGRIGRALAERAIAQDLGSAKRLWSLSKQILLQRKVYYEQLQAMTGQANLDATPWILWFVGCVMKAAQDCADQMLAASQKTRYWQEVRERFPAISVSQTKAVNKLYDAGPQGFVGGLSTEKYVRLCGVSRATAYRELTQLSEWGVLHKTGVGRATRYELAAMS
jgi:Fic family protein